MVRFVSLAMLESWWLLASVVLQQTILLFLLTLSTVSIWCYVDSANAHEVHIWNMKKLRQNGVRSKHERLVVGTASAHRTFIGSKSTIRAKKGIARESSIAKQRNLSRNTIRIGLYSCFEHARSLATLTMALVPVGIFTTSIKILYKCFACVINLIARRFSYYDGN